MAKAIPAAAFARLYGDLAWLWPLVSPAECYEEESACLADMVTRYARRPVTTMLHLGCASGQHECALRHQFAITGVDLSGEMISQARHANPAGAYTEGDLRTVRLGTAFDAVLLLDAVNYMVTETDLRAAFETAWEHLAPGGVFVTLAEYTVENFEPSQPRESRLEHERTRIILTEWHEPCPAGATQFTGVYEFRIERNGSMAVERDNHAFGLFPTETWRRLLRAQFGNLIEPDFEETSQTCPVFVCVREA